MKVTSIVLTAFYRVHHFIVIFQNYVRTVCTIYFCTVLVTVNNIIIGLVWCPGQNKRIAPLSFLLGCRKRRLKD
jgi:hypothetical protein